MGIVTADVYHVIDEEYHPSPLREGEKIDLGERCLGEVTASEPRIRMKGRIPKVNRRAIEKTVIKSGPGEYVSVYKNSLHRTIEYEGEELEGIIASIVFHGKDPIQSSITEFKRGLLELGVVKAGLIPEKRIRLYKTV